MNEARGGSRKAVEVPAQRAPSDEQRARRAVIAPLLHDVSSQNRKRLAWHDALEHQMAVELEAAPVAGERRSIGFQHALPQSKRRAAVHRAAFSQPSCGAARTLRAGGERFAAPRAPEPPLDGRTTGTAF